MNKTDKKRIADFLGKCILKYHKKSIHFSPQRYLMVGKCMCVGWANEDGIKIATGKEAGVWLECFVHETCHLDQDVCKPKWHKAAYQALEDFEDWLGGKRIKNIDKTARLCIQIEHDCEVRTIRKINRYKLPINTGVYAQKANAYMLSYTQTRIDRKWYREHDDVWKLMPKKLLPLKIALKPPQKLLDIYTQCK
jgi:hypothetical protein